MDKISQKDIDWLLNLNKADIRQGHEPSAAKKKWLQFSFWGLLIATLGILPFFILIRTSIFLNLSFGWNGWVALGGGILATVLLLLLYVLFLFRKTSNKRLLLKFSLAGLSTLVFAFCFYGVMYLSSVNAKNDDVRLVYRSMHPILRVAIATTTLADGDLVITDIQRTPEDYASMGIPLNEGSLHFPQASGYVHAIDLRTIGHSEFRNFLLRTSLRVMGLKTIRHDGTADHLHAALPTSY